MKRLVLFFWLALGQVAVADPDLDGLIASIHADFAGLPSVVAVGDISEVCGTGAEGLGVYCPRERQIFMAQTAENPDQAAYTLAHLYGHAMQVRYGVADVALAAIRADRPREAELRSMVTRQVECLAGMMLARAGFRRPDLNTIFETEPMTGSHWGRNPVRNGPRVRIGMAARNAWLARGYDAGHPNACDVDEMPVEMITRQFRG